jgi:hypothetical protein
MDAEAHTRLARQVGRLRISSWVQWGVIVLQWLLISRLMGAEAMRDLYGELIPACAAVLAIPAFFFLAHAVRRRLDEAETKK